MSSEEGTSSTWDSMQKKRKHMITWLFNAGIFLMALALHWSMTQLIDDIIPDDGDMKTKLIRRLGYPAIIFVVFWWLKSLS